MLCMSGEVGEAAKWAVKENRYGNPSLKLDRRRPFPATTSRLNSGKSRVPVLLTAEAHTWGN